MILGRQFREFGHEAADIVAVGIEFLALQHGIEDAEDRGPHRRRSRPPIASSRRCWRDRHRPACPRTKPRPSCQSISRCLIRNEATIMRTRLCIQPVSQSWRMPASTIGKPVRPRCQARKCQRSSCRQGSYRTAAGSCGSRDRDCEQQVVGEFAPAESRPRNFVRSAAAAPLSAGQHAHVRRHAKPARADFAEIANAGRGETWRRLSGRSRWLA